MPDATEAGMRPGIIHSLVVACVLATSAAGCTVEETSPAVYATSDYEPQYYDGYVVYYDTWGHPYYYRNGVNVYISARSPYYRPLYGHWYAHRPGYRAWYVHHGYRYRGHRYYHH
jgi:hypothetical protein